MLMVERTVRYMYALDVGTKMPKKGEKLLVVPPSALGKEPHAIFWTDRKSDDGKRLFNAGVFREDGTEPPLFQD